MRSCAAKMLNTYDNILPDRKLLHIGPRRGTMQKVLVDCERVCSMSTWITPHMLRLHQDLSQARRPLQRPLAWVPLQTTLVIWAWRISMPMSRRWVATCMRRHVTVVCPGHREALARNCMRKGQTSILYCMPGLFQRADPVLHHKGCTCPFADRDAPMQKQGVKLPSVLCLAAERCARVDNLWAATREERIPAVLLQR